MQCDEWSDFARMFHIVQVTSSRTLDGKCGFQTLECGLGKLLGKCSVVAEAICNALFQLRVEKSPQLVACREDLRKTWFSQSLNKLCFRDAGCMGPIASDRGPSKNSECESCPVSFVALT